MNSRQRLMAALNHQEPDRVPFDLGGTVLTSLHVNTYRNLRRYLGLPEVEVQVMDIFQQIAVVDEDVRARLGSDVRIVAPRSSATFRIALEYDRSARLRLFPRRVGYRLAQCPKTAASSTTCSTIRWRRRRRSRRSRTSRGRTRSIRRASRACAERAQPRGRGPGRAGHPGRAGGGLLGADVLDARLCQGVSRTW